LKKKERFFILLLITFFIIFYSNCSTKNVNDSKNITRIETKQAKKSLSLEKLGRMIAQGQVNILKIDMQNILLSDESRNKFILGMCNEISPTNISEECFNNIYKDCAKRDNANVFMTCAVTGFMRNYGIIISEKDKTDAMKLMCQVHLPSKLHAECFQKVYNTCSEHNTGLRLSLCGGATFRRFYSDKVSIDDLVKANIVVALCTPLSKKLDLRLECFHKIYDPCKDNSDDLEKFRHCIGIQYRNLYGVERFRKAFPNFYATET